MPRYIDAERFNHFDYDDDRGIEFDSPKEAYTQGVEFVLNAIDETPTADVQEVKHGHFYEFDDGKQHCSSCGAYKIGYKRFCSYCGARMDGDKE